jgi:RNA polymerase sigma factor (sigma-70 family)
MNNRVDGALIQECQSGERLAFQRLYDSLISSLLATCRQYASDPDEARSFFVHGFYKIAINLDRFDGRVLFETWAKRILINSIIDELRQRERHRRYFLQLDDLEGFDSRRSFNEYETEANAEDLLSLVNRLPPCTRDVFLLRSTEEKSHKEIAAMLHISEGTSKWHVSSARKRLKEMLTE